MHWRNPPLHTLFYAVLAPTGKLMCAEVLVKRNKTLLRTFLLCFIWLFFLLVLLLLERHAHP